MQKLLISAKTLLHFEEKDLELFETKCTSKVRYISEYAFIKLFPGQKIQTLYISNSKIRVQTLLTTKAFFQIVDITKEDILKKIFFPIVLFLHKYYSNLYSINLYIYIL